ncbi:hypothetical protein [Comamonas sp. C24C]
MEPLPCWTKARPSSKFETNHASTVGRKGSKHQYLRNETGVQELKEASAQRIRAYKAEWMRRKRAENPGFDNEAKRRRRANRTPDQRDHEQLVACM